MNERIKELAKEHGFVRWDYDSLSYELKGDIEDLYAFAELIVRECINQAHSVGDLRGANDDMTFGAYTAARKISKHFGVEE